LQFGNVGFCRGKKTVWEKTLGARRESITAAKQKFCPKIWQKLGKLSKLRINGRKSHSAHACWV